MLEETFTGGHVEYSPWRSPGGKPPAAMRAIAVLCFAMTLHFEQTGRVAIVPTVVDVCVLHRVAATGRARSDAGAGMAWRTLLLQRGVNGRCPGSWEMVHGSIKAGERPEAAAVRELFEETGLRPLRLYTVTVNAFYLAGRDIQAALVFAAVCGDGGAPAPPVLGAEHVDASWHSLAAARRRATWPREREVFDHVAHLLRSGDAGVAEDVLRVPLD